MADLAHLLDVFSEYAHTLTGQYEISVVLDRLMVQTAEVLELDGAGVFLDREGGGLQFMSATDDGVARIEKAQIDVGEGPCHDAFTSGEANSSNNLNEESRWPNYRVVALGQGCRAVAGLPMRANRSHIGAINLYMRTPRDWSDQDVKIGQTLANMAAGYLKNIELRNAAEDMNGRLQHALDSRIIIEQAKGILAERTGLSPVEAYEQIRRHARNSNQKIHAVADQIVAGTLDI